MNTTQLQKLTSVGCYIDKETLFTYPMLEDGTCDMNDDIKVHIKNVSDEWYDNLSDYDFNVMQSILNLKHLTK